MTPKSRDNPLLEELNHVKAKLNEQKETIAKLERAIAWWRREAVFQPIAVYKGTYSVHLRPTMTPSERDHHKQVALWAAIIEWTDTAKVPGYYYIRVTPTTIPASEVFSSTDTFRPYEEYHVELYVWEKNNVASTDNEGK